MARSSPRRRARKPLSKPGYTVTLRTGSLDGRVGERIEFQTTDNALYRHTVVWNERFVAARLRGRANDGRAGAVPDGDSATAAQTVLVAIGLGKSEKVGALLDAALELGIVQVELDWSEEGVGYAARLFPWEQMLRLAARDKRRLSGRDFVVIRRLAQLAVTGPAADGPPLIVTTRDAFDAPFGIAIEADVVSRAVQVHERTVPAVVASPAELERRLTAGSPPRLVHFMLRSVDRGIVFDAEDRATPPTVDDPDHTSQGAAARAPRKSFAEADRIDSAKIAAILGRRRPALVSLSSCYTGRRLAPLVVAAGADLVVALHQEVEDENLPAFFGRYYERWTASGDPVAALKAALAFNRDQPDHDGLGPVTLWSAADQLAGRTPARGRTPRLRPAAQPAAGAGASGPPRALVFDCDPEASLNYSILHNSRGGLFRRFMVTALDTPVAEPLAVTVRLDTGAARPAECRFSCDPPKVAYGRVDLARRVHLPLGDELLRQRRETTRATVEVLVAQGGRPLFHETRRVEVLPADEWKDDRSGNHFLPSFIFPRDAAVREIISAAQPFLRALGDRCDIAFDGYQQAAASAPGEALASQVRAIWSALQHGFRIDYVNPPPAYLAGSQRIRTPGEILRARRATCIEMSLLLAACWEHVGIDPVLFLIPGHAFCGYWTGEKARDDFLTGRFLGDAEGIPVADDARTRATSLGGTVVNRDNDQAWLFADRFDLRQIQRAVRGGGLMPVEATGLTLLRSFGESCAEARELVSAASAPDFDGMFDVRSARDRGVDPLPILLDGPAA